MKKDQQSNYTPEPATIMLKASVIAMFIVLVTLVVIFVITKVIK
jgi:hypothetical protein